MPTITAGGSATFTSYDNGTVSVASNSGFASISIAQVAGPAISESWGPGPFRKVYGPFKEGATVTVSSQSADVNYDGAPIPADTSSLVSGAGNLLTLKVISDSIQGQSVDAPAAHTTLPASGFGGTFAKGSYYDLPNSQARTNGIRDIYAENPCRIRFRNAPNLVTGDEVMLYVLPSAHPLTCRRYTLTQINATEYTLNGIDATGMPTLTSASAATDAMAFVDMSFANYGPLSWFLYFAGPVFSRVDGVMRPGATSAQLVTACRSQDTSGVADIVLLHPGRNDSAFDQVSLEALRDHALSQAKKYVIFVITQPDGYNGSGWDAAALAKLKSISAWAYAQQAIYPKFKVCDFFGTFSDPTLTLEGGDSAVYYSTDSGPGGPGYVHPNGNGGVIGGAKIQQTVPDVVPPERAAGRVGSGSTNLLSNARFPTVTGGTLTGLIAGAAPAGWTIGEATTGRSNNLNGKYAQEVRTPAVTRANSTAYIKGQILDIGDGWWYLVKTGGTTAAALPEAAYQGFLTGSATYDPASLTAGSGATTTVTVTGAVLGDSVTAAAFSLDLQGITLTAWVSAANTVSVRFQNNTAGAIDLASGTLSVQVKRVATMLLDTALGVTDGSVVSFRIPKFTKRVDRRVGWLIYPTVSSDSATEFLSMSQSLALPASVVPGDYVQASVDLVQLAGLNKGFTLRLTCEGGGSQLGAAHGLAIKSLLDRPVSRDIEIKTLFTPKRQVPAGTDTLRFRLLAFLSVSDAPFIVFDPMLEETTPPGQIY